MPKGKSYRQVERIIKGFANHRRLMILELIEKKPELSVAEISDELKLNFKTSSDHIRRMAIAGLVLKRSDGLSVRHRLTDRAKTILKFLRILE